MLVLVVNQHFHVGIVWEGILDSEIIIKGIKSSEKMRVIPVRFSVERFIRKTCVLVHKIKKTDFAGTI